MEQQEIRLLLDARDRAGIDEEVDHLIRIKAQGNLIGGGEPFLDKEADRYFLRKVFEPRGLSYEETGKRLKKGLIDLRKNLEDAHIRVTYPAIRPKKAVVFVGPDEHCLDSLLTQQERKLLNIDITAVLGNHQKAEKKVLGRKTFDGKDLKFYYIPNKDFLKEEIFKIPEMREAYFAIFARFMLIVPPEFLNNFGSKEYLTPNGKDVLNIHHGSLPGYRGSRPYHRAFQLRDPSVGATAHFVIPEVDKGAMISKANRDVSHFRSLTDYMRAGENAEQDALIEAVSLYEQDRLIKYSVEVENTGLFDLTQDPVEVLPNGKLKIRRKVSF